MKNAFKRCASVVMLILLVAGLTAAVVPAIAETATATPAATTAPTTAATAKPTSINLDQTGTVRLNLGDKLTLTPTLYPENASSTLKWTSSKKTVAKVSSKGVVTPKKVGTATITVTTANKKKAKVKVKVVDAYKPTSVSLDVSGTQTLMVMNTLQLNATMKPDTAKSTLKWTSSNKKVAVVNQSGLVSGIKPGKATITVTTHNKKKAKIKVKVIDDGNQPITTQPDYDLPYVIYACKNSHTIAVLAKDDNGEWTRVIKKFPTGMGKNNVTDVGVFFLQKKERWHKWGSGYSPYANRISVGIYLHGPIYKSKNHNTIRPSYYNSIGKDGSSGCLRTTCGCAGWIYYNCPVGTQIIIAQNSRFSEPRPAKLGKKAKKDPTDPGSNFEILVTDFQVQPAELTLTQGKTQTIAPTNVKPSSNTNGGKFTYYSNNAAVATVSDSGVVTAVAPGTATLLVTAADAFKRAVPVTVTVTAAESDSTATAAEAIGEQLEAGEAAVIEAGAEVIPDSETFEVVGTVEVPAAETQVTDDASTSVEIEAGEQTVEASEPEAAESSPAAEDEADAEEEIIAGTYDDGIVGEGDGFWFAAEDVEEDLSIEPID